MIAAPAVKTGYAWMIDVDHLVEGPEDHNDVGLTGPHSASTEHLAALARGEGLPFRLLDDDGELYFTGRIIGGGPDAEETAAFGPLWDYGTPGAGATEIQYQDPTGQWVAL